MLQSQLMIHKNHNSDRPLFTTQTEQIPYRQQDYSGVLHSGHLAIRPFPASMYTHLSMHSR